MTYCTADEILASLKIARPTWRSGDGTPLSTFWTLCPKCSAMRSSGRKRRKPCLHVVIMSKRVTWRCANCTWLGIAQIEHEGHAA
jgi:hypothetical protein